MNAAHGLRAGMAITGVSDQPPLRIPGQPNGRLRPVPAPRPTMGVGNSPKTRQDPLLPEVPVLGSSAPRVVSVPSGHHRLHYQNLEMWLPLVKARLAPVLDYGAIWIDRDGVRENSITPLPRAWDLPTPSLLRARRRHALRRLSANG